VKAAEEAIEESRRALADGGLEKLNAAIDGLTKVSHRIAESLYKVQQAAAGSSGAGGAGQPGPEGSAGANGNPSGQGDVVDAEFVDVDESKKPN
jgi:molecular chaperone DnaK